MMKQQLKNNGAVIFLLILFGVLNIFLLTNIYASKQKEKDFELLLENAKLKAARANKKSAEYKASLLTTIQRVTAIDKRLFKNCFQNIFQKIILDKRLFNVLFPNTVINILFGNHVPIGTMVW